MHVIKIIVFFLRRNSHMPITTIGNVTIGTGMLGTIFGFEIVMIRPK